MYAVFLHDFGEEEHVFMPVRFRIILFTHRKGHSYGVFNQPRRWLQRQKEAFFTLSPAEKHLAAAAKDRHYQSLTVDVNIMTWRFVSKRLSCLDRAQKGKGPDKIPIIQPV